MASLRKKPRSPFWFACFTTAEGVRVQRSTKQSNRKKAQAFADALERAAKLGAEKRLGETQARRILAEIYQTVNGETLASSTSREFLTNWAERRKADTSLRTFQAYRQVIRDFVASLGDRADRDISQLSKSDVAKYRDAVLARTSAATANKSLKYLRVALGSAYKDGLLQDNPAAKLDSIKRREGDGVDRRPFTLEELGLILANASGEWRGIILFGLYTGQRLGDIAKLGWNNIDLTKNELRFVTSKTGRRMHVPLAAPLVAHLQSLPAGEDPAAPLFPAASRIAHQSGDSRLSQQFYEILFAAGLATDVRQRNGVVDGKARNERRKVNTISFHSLRHTATSLLKAAGIPESVVRDIIGHDSAAVSRHYTHVEAGAKREAIDTLPAIPVKKPTPHPQKQ